MNKIFSGHQPNFMPYMGYFYKMYMSDVFVLDDDVQFSNEEYHNYNYIRINDSKFKMIIPVSYEFGDKINEVKICYKKPWIRKMLETLRMNYGKCEHFEETYKLIEDALNKNFEYISDLNIYLINEIVKRMGIETKIVIASKDVPTELTNNARNIYQCSKLGCNVYLSGIGGKAYNDIEGYKEKGIEVIYSDYEPLKYRQRWKKEFMENLSSIDYFMNEGFIIPNEWSEKHGRRKIRNLCA